MLTCTGCGGDFCVCAACEGGGMDFGVCCPGCDDCPREDDEYAYELGGEGGCG